MAARRVFILGAGFSKQAGMPLAADIALLILEQFCNHNRYEREEAIAWSSNIRDRLGWLYRQQNGVLTSINFEMIFDLARLDIEKWLMDDQISNRTSAIRVKHCKIAEHIDAWLQELEETLQSVIWQKQREAQLHLEAISNFTKILRPEDTILTFNYDTLVEDSLTTQQKPWSHGFACEQTGGTKILKMHGSINWLIKLKNEHHCLNDGTLLFSEDNRNYPNRSEFYELIRIPFDRMGEFVDRATWQETFYEIGLAPLGMHKPLDYLPGSNEVWFNAKEAIENAEELCVVGFSFSSFDTQARLYFAGVMCERAKHENLPKMITIIDPDADSLLLNFRSVFGHYTPISIYAQYAENVNWCNVLLR